MSAIDLTTLPTLVEIFGRDEDPTDHVEAGHLADIIENSATLADDRRPVYADRERSLAMHFAANPPDEGDNYRRVLGLMWSAELTESPGLYRRIIDSVADPEVRADLSAHHEAGIETLLINQAIEARRWESWREPPPGAEWHPIDEFILELYATRNGAELNDIADSLVNTVSRSLEGFAPHIESVLRALVPAGVDVQIGASR